MKSLHGHVLIDAPLETVFDFVADERNEPRYNPRTASAEMITPGPVGLDSCFVATMRDARHTAVHVEYTEFSRPHTITSVSRMAGMDIEGTLAFTVEGGLTRLSWTWKFDTHGLLRLISPVVRAIGDRQERSNWARLKDHLERAGTR